MAIVEQIRPEFSGWYKEFEMGESEARANTRWDGIQKIAQNVDAYGQENLLRLAFKSKQLVAAAELDKIKQVFKSEDGQVEIPGARELQVLAAATLAVLMLERYDVDTMIAVSTTDFIGAREVDLPMDLPAIARAALSTFAETNRRRPPLGRFSSVAPAKLDFTKAIEKYAQGSANDFAGGMTIAADLIKQFFTAIAKNQASEIGLIEDFIRIQDEELDMLWWLIGERSGVLDLPFSEIPEEARPIVHGIELGRATAVRPGPASIKALLERAGIESGKQLRLNEAVNAISDNVLKDLVEGKSVSPVSMPIHFAITRRLETGPNDTWVANWAAVCEVNAERAISSLELGIQFYRERLLLQWQ